MLTNLNYLLINFLIVLALYGLIVKKNLPYQKHLIALLISLALIYNLTSHREGFQDFSITPRASLDIFCHETDNLNPNSPTEFACKSPPQPHPLDKCQHCDGLCTQGPVGKGYPAEAYPLCKKHPLIKNGVGYYKVQSLKYPTKYLAYDLNGLDGNGIMLYLAEPKDQSQRNQADLVWKIDREMDIFRISTCRQPALYLEAKSEGRIGMSYFKTGAWELLQRVGNEILIRSKNPTYYLTTDGRQVKLNSYLQSWRLISTTPCQQNTIEGFANDMQFPDTPKKVDNDLSKNYGVMQDWNKYYSEFWNGEYAYKNTTANNNDYLTIHIYSDGHGTISTRNQVWKVRSISPDLLYGENKSSYIYLEMLTKEVGKEYYDENRPQIKIIMKQKNSASKTPLQSLVGQDPNNLNAYAPKVGSVGDKVQGYPNEKYTNFLPTSMLQDGISYLSSKLGYQLPEANLNIKKPCLMDNPKKAPVWSNYWAKIDKTQKLKQMISQIGPLGPMDVQYSYVYKCNDGTTQESARSPITRIPTSTGSDGYYYMAMVNVFGSESVHQIKVYVKGPGDKDFIFSTVVESKTGKVMVLVTPNVVKKILSEKQCFYGDPTNVPVNTGYSQAFDKTGKLKAIGKFGPMSIQYTYVYECEDGRVMESKPSPILTIKEPASSSGYYNSIIYIFGNKTAKTVKVYVKGEGDNSYILNQEVSNRDSKFEVYVTPRYIKEILEGK